MFGLKTRRASWDELDAELAAKIRVCDEVSDRLVRETSKANEMADLRDLGGQMRHAIILAKSHLRTGDTAAAMEALEVSLRLPGE